MDSYTPDAVATMDDATLIAEFSKITGRADVPGRPLQYGTTDQFLERFGLASLQELPSVKEWKQLG
jgi:segregation and condensation protein B